MKKIGVVLSMILVLGGNAFGCCWHFCGPSFAFGLGLGCGVGFSVSTGLGCGYACPGYSYYPGYTYGYPAASYAYYEAPASYGASAPAYANVSQPAFEPATQGWVPKGPGAGQWVPDPTPYRYVPSAPAKPAAQVTAANAPVVMLTPSPEGIPLYTICR
jgi:hypothetical protein